MPSNPMALLALAISVGCLVLMATAAGTTGWYVSTLKFEDGTKVTSSVGLFQSCAKSPLLSTCKSIVPNFDNDPQMFFQPVCPSKPNGMTFEDQQSSLQAVQAFAILGSIAFAGCCLFAAARLGMTPGTTKQQAAGAGVAFFGLCGIASLIIVWAVYFSTLNYCFEYCEGLKATEKALLPAGTQFDFTCGLNYSFGLSVVAGLGSFALIVLGALLFKKETGVTTDPSAAGINYLPQEA